MSVVTSGLCTNQGKEWPEGARVTELVWGQLRTRSGAKAWYRRKALNSTIGPVGGVASPSWCCTSGSWQGAAATGIRTNLLVSGGGAGARVTAIASEAPKGRVLVPARRRRVIAATHEPETRMGGRSLLAGGQRAAVGPATRHGEAAVLVVPLLLCRTSGRHRTTLPGLCRLRQPACVSGPDVTAVVWASASPAAAASSRRWCARTPAPARCR